MSERPVIIAGAGPVGLVTALGLAAYGIPAIVLEEDATLSTDTKAGTILPRTLEVLRRYGAEAPVLRAALRVDEVGDIDRARNAPRASLHTEILRDDTRFPFFINIPQHHMEPVVAAVLESRLPGCLRFSHRVLGVEQDAEGVRVRVETPAGEAVIEGSTLLACDGGRSTIRRQLGLTTEGFSLETRYMLIDVAVDLDLQNPRDYPYLAYFSDAQEWMVLVRQPHCWRFLFPLAKDAPEPDEAALRAKVAHFIGDAEDMQVLQRIIYPVHHRVASSWRQGSVFLMGDAAHLITPMWALGLNTGILDANSLPWRLAWVRRGWAHDALLDGYEREQKPVAVEGSGEMAEAARRYMGNEQAKAGAAVKAMAGDAWGMAYTRALLGVRVAPEGGGEWSMVKERRGPLLVGDRLPDWMVQAPDGTEQRLHDLGHGRFMALVFGDARRRPAVPAEASPALVQYLVSRWDAPHDSGLRDRTLLDPGARLRERAGCGEGTLVLVRPDQHIAAIEPFRPGLAEEIYTRICGLPPPASA